MIRLTKGAPSGEKKVFLSEIPIGTTFFGDISSSYTNRLLFRVYGGIVDLERPSTTWMFHDEGAPGLRKFDITNYRPVDIVGEIKEING